MHHSLPSHWDDLIAHLASSTDISPALARRLVGDVLAYVEETVDAYVLRRHGELVAQGFKNDAIFARLCEELQQRPFATAPLSPRQVRRLIYG